MCTVLLPPGVNPVAVKYIIPYRTVTMKKMEKRRGGEATQYSMSLTELGCVQCIEVAQYTFRISEVRIVIVR